MEKPRMNSAKPTFKEINSLRFVRSQDPEMFQLINDCSARETMPPKPIVRQILLHGLRSRVKQTLFWNPMLAEGRATDES